MTQPPDVQFKERKKDAPQASPAPHDEGQIHTGIIIAVFIFIALLVLACSYLVSAMRENTRLERCIESGGRACARTIGNEDK